MGDGGGYDMACDFLFRAMQAWAPPLLLYSFSFLREGGLVYNPPRKAAVQHSSPKTKAADVSSWRRDGYEGGDIATKKGVEVVT